MHPWRRPALAAAAIIALAAPLSIATITFAQPPTELGISYDGAIYVPMVNDEHLDNPVSSSGDETETVERFDVNGNTVEFVSYGADVGVTEKTKRLSSGTASTARKINTGTTREDGSFVIDESVAATGPSFTERTVSAENLDMESVAPTLAVAHSEDAIAVNWGAMDTPRREYKLIVGGEVVSEGTGSHLEAVIPDVKDRTAELFLADPLGEMPDTVRTFPLAQAASSGQIQTKGYQENSTAYLHVTFIPDSKVSINSFQNLGCGEIPGKSVSFGGDSRSWHLPTPDFPLTADTVPSFRTLVFVYVNWQNANANKIHEMVGIGETTKYVDDALVETRRFSGPGALLQNPSASSSSATFKVLHRAPNPFCNVGAIDYEEQVTMYRATGMVEVAGFRWPVPAHEIYVRTDLSSGAQRWETLSRRSNEGFNCLAAAYVCGKDEYALNN